MKTKNREIQEISNQFSLGSVLESKELHDGIINSSFSVETSRGKFIFQMLNDVFDERTVQDYQDVQSYVRTNGLHVPVLLTSVYGKPYYRNSNLWRVFEYIPHDENPELNLDNVFELGKTLGKFHRLMKSSGFKPSFSLEGFHDVENVIESLNKSYMDDNDYVKRGNVTKEYDFILSRIYNHFLPENLEKTIIHGDPNYENFLIKDNKVISILDLDTLMEASPLIDVGDALRSWSKKDGKFQPSIFYRALEGYRLENDLPYGDSLFMKATGLITLELASRFLTDYFEESYFSWDNLKYESSAEHNLARTRECLKYYNDFAQEFAKENF